LAAALASPRDMPLTIDLSDVTARYVRINAPAFHARDVTIYRP